MNKLHVLKQYPREFWILLIAAFLNQSGNMAFIFLAPFFTHHLSLTLTNASFAFAMFGFSTMLSALFGGFLVDRIGAMRCMLMTLVLNALILIAFTFVKHYPALLIMCLIWGFVFGLFRPATQTLLTFISPPNYSHCHGFFPT